MRAILLIVLLLTLTSCAEWQAAKIGVSSHGAQAADEALTTAMWTMCNAIPVGAVKRRFKTIEEREAYNSLCPDVLP